MRDLLATPAFLEGRTTTDFIEREMSQWRAEQWKPEDGSPPDEVLVAAALAEELQRTSSPFAAGRQAVVTPWQTVGRWQIGGGA